MALQFLMYFFFILMYRICHHLFLVLSLLQIFGLCFALYIHSLLNRRLAVVLKTLKTQVRFVRISSEIWYSSHDIPRHNIVSGEFLWYGFDFFPRCFSEDFVLAPILFDSLRSGKVCVIKEWLKIADQLIECREKTKV